MKNKKNSKTTQIKTSKSSKTNSKKNTSSLKNKPVLKITNKNSKSSPDKFTEKKLIKKTINNQAKNNLKKIYKNTNNKIVKNSKSSSTNNSKSNKNSTHIEIETENNHELTKIIKSKKIENKKSQNSKNYNFSINDYVVYPSHGVGKVIDIENTIVMQQHISCYMIYFDKDKLTIKIPVKNADKFGIRALASKSQMDEVFSILRSGVKKMKGMWSRRAQEYETKINSGDIIMLAEVIRDLTRDIEDAERSYSERIIYETAIFRLACEYSAIFGIEFEEARQKVIITAKDKLESESKQNFKDDDFDDFDKIKLKDKNDEFDDEDDEEEEEEDDDFNYEYNEDDDFDDEDDKPKKKKK